MIAMTDWNLEGTSSEGKRVQVIHFEGLEYYCLINQTTSSMLDFGSQKKLLDPILKDPKNIHCADCDSVSPTWASLDFGVFLCSNCSGAHRGLGPTITRVRSANLDKWQQEWLGNMQIGNTELNLFWEGDPHAKERKPKAGAELSDIARYVFEKYVKRKFVKDRDQPDPLTLYKQGKYSPSKNQAEKQPQKAPNLKPKQPEPVKPKKVQTPSIPLKKQINLLDLDIESAPVQMPLQHHRSEPKPTSTKDVNLIQDDDDFTEFAQAGSIKSEEERKNGTDMICFDNLMSQQQQMQPPQQVHHNFNSYDGLKSHNMQFHHPYNPHIGHHNLVYQGQYQYPPLQQQRGHHFSQPHGYQQPMMPQMQQGTFW